MRHAVVAEVFITELAEKTGIGKDTIDTVFSGIPLDFTIIVADTLPLGAQRRGMVGLTLFGKVHLLERIRTEYTAAQLLAVVRHESEHIKQQRSSPLLFYIGYGLGWLGNFGTQLFATHGRAECGRHGPLRIPEYPGGSGSICSRSACTGAFAIELSVARRK